LTSSERGGLVVGTSAAVAVILGEPGGGELAGRLEDALAAADVAAVRPGTPTPQETQ
jgi:uncharacterized protein with PIN domain